MIQVIVEKQNENIVAFHATGHSGYAEHGSDIICSAVSALAINCINSIEQFTDDVFTFEQDDESGMLACHFDGAISEQSKLLMNSFVLGLEGISKQYGKQYVTVEIVRRK